MRKFLEITKNKQVDFKTEISVTICQNTGITRDVLRYSSSRSNQNFTLLTRFTYF